VESYGSDTSTYFELARSLRHEHRYWFDFAPHTIYPPGYPVLLAGLMALVGEGFAPLVKLSVPIYFVGLLALYWLVKLRRGPKTAFVVVLLGAVSTVGYFWTTVGLHSDVPYFTVSVCTLLFVELAGRTSTGPRRAVMLLLASLGAAYLVVLRTVGVTLVAGLILWALLPRAPGANTPASFAARARRWLPVVLLPILVMIAWTSWTGRHAADEPRDFMQSYTQQILKGDPHQIDSPNITPLQVPARMARMLKTRAASAAITVLNVPPFLFVSWYNPLTLALLVTAALGFLVAMRRERSALEFYILAYVGLLLIWPFDEGTRFIFPIQAFLLLYGIDGLAVLRRRAAELGTRIGGFPGAFLGNNALFLAGRGILLAVIVGAGLYGISRQARVNLHPDPSRFSNARTVTVAEWAKGNTRSSDVIMDDQDAILHRLTGRKTMRFPLVTDPGVITERILADQVDYVVVLKERPFEYYNPSTARRFERVRTLHPEMFAPVYEFDGGTVYAVDRGSNPPIPAAGSNDPLSRTTLP
jgi:hypothetical protein